MTVYREVKSENNIDPRAMAEAEQWLSRIEGGQCLSADRQVFERWLAQPAHAAAYREVEQFWRVFDGAQEDSQAQALIARTLADTAGRASKFRLTFALAASVLVVLIGTAALALSYPYWRTHLYITEAGQRSTVQLDDGSQIILNSATRLSVKFTAHRREFKLNEGEAIFEVAKDPARPFIVLAGDGEVTALGTRFQVRKQTQRVIVTLLEGRIALGREGVEQSLQLEPGEQVRFIKDDPHVARSTVDPEIVSSWSDGRLKFKGAALAEVLEEVNRYSKTKIRLADASLSSLRVTATFDMGNSASVVSALEALLPVRAAEPMRDEIILIARSEIGG